MLATLSDGAFNDQSWIFEVKWDGYRAIAELNQQDIKLYSRNGLSFNQLYPTVADALKQLNVEAILDGEIVVLDEDNKPDFQRLQQFGDLKKGSIVYYVFDCLSVSGNSITRLPLIERKQILKKLLGNNNSVRYVDHFIGNGIEYFNAAREMDIEGIIAKRAESIYHAGKRSTDWLKIKNHNIQEAIIAGYTAPRGSRQFFGALILAIVQHGTLKYIGHTGTGFTQRSLNDLHQKLRPLARTTSPFTTKIPVNSSVTWVDPKLVCNIKFTEITQGGILRHPVFMGLRVDKSAKEADHLELPASTSLSVSKVSRRTARKQKSKTPKM